MHDKYESFTIKPIPPSLPAAGSVADLVEKPYPGFGMGRREDTTKWKKKYEYIR